MAIHVLGIRHHGPGSARNVKAFLAEIKPDIVLIEGPPEADAILQWADHPEIKPPVAILCYQPDNPEHSSFYPFAEFSPEWQAIQYAKQHHIHARFMDLPSAHHFAIEAKRTKREDPITHFAQAAGYEEGEKWWEHMFEHRLNNEAVFEAVQETMTQLREYYTDEDDKLEQLREAYMRKVIRQAEKEMFQNIAVICGAWHAPALVNMPKQKEDNELLKNLPKVKTECTWVPWTYNRLSFTSGYGAGIHSPGWYEHIWHHPKDDGTLWMAKVAKLFREQQMDTSVAHVIESVRLAESLASLRHLHKAGLEELNEATLSVLCNGEDVMMSLVHEALIVSNKIGEVPLDIPKPPLQVDIEKLQKKLRLPATADWKDYTLDLRKENDLERSIFLHRLGLLDIKWGHSSAISGKGTFKEQWRLQWDPAFSVEIIEKGSWGNTTAEAASKYVIHTAEKADSLKKVCALLEETIPAELPDAIDHLIHQINNLAAASGDVIQLMEVIPALVNVSRYGNVRKTDAELVLNIISSMITRICVSLPAACTAVDEDAAQHLLELFYSLNDAVNILQQADMTEQWQQTLFNIAGSKHTAPMIAGYANRLLTDYKLLGGEELVKVFYYATSSANAPAIAAAWLEGFLKGSGMLLLLDPDLWTVINNWVSQLDEGTFVQVLPLLRRTFSNYSPSERRKLGEKVKSGGQGVTIKTAGAFDEERAMKGIPVILQLLGYQQP